MNWKERARSLKRDIRALVLAMGDPRLPWYARLLAGLILAYAVSPIDLIPDFIPLFGYLDDLVLIPLGLMLLVRLVPAAVLEDARQRALVSEYQGAHLGRIGAALVIAIWLATLFTIAALVWQWMAVPVS